MNALPAILFAVVLLAINAFFRQRRVRINFLSP